MESHAIPKAVDEFDLEEIDDELLLYHPTRTRAVYLNESAALVWQLCDGKRSVAEITELLQENYPDSETIDADVAQTLQQLSDNGAIEMDAAQ